MATATISPNSPVPTQVRNFATVGPALINQIQKAAHGTITHTAARSAINAALATIVDDAQPEPIEWEPFVTACDQILNSSEAAPSKDARLKLLKTAELYLRGLLDAVEEEEAKRQWDRGYFVTHAQALDHDYLISAMTSAMANNQVINFEAS